MSNTTFVYIDMSNPPTGSRGGANERIDYFGWLRKQLEEMQADSDVAVMTLIIPAKRLVDSGEADLSSWPQLHQQYAAFPRDSHSSAEEMMPTFLRVVADSIDRVRGHTGYGQHANTQAPPQQAQNSSNIKIEPVMDQSAHMSFDRAPGHHGHSMPANPAVPSSNAFPAAQGPPAPLDINSFGRLAPSYALPDPNSATHHPQQSRPVPNPGDSNQQAETPVNSATSLGSYGTGFPTPGVIQLGYPHLQGPEGIREQAGEPVSSATSLDSPSTGYPSLVGIPHHSNSSSRTPSVNPLGFPPAPRSGQLPHGQPPLPETRRPATAYGPQAVSSAHYGAISPGFGVTRSVGSPNPFSPVNPFPGSAWTPALSTASRQRSQSSASLQGQSFFAASAGSQGTGNSARSSTTIQGRRLMGARGLAAGTQNRTGPTGGTDNSNNTGNNTGNNDQMGFAGPTHHGQGFH